MLAVGANIFIERFGNTTLLGHLEIARHFDLREKKLFRNFEYCLSASPVAAGEISVDNVTSFISPGIGQADVRFITFEDGSPFFMENRLWATVSVRGFKGGWPQQGVISIDPSVFDVKYEGIIVFDRNDGLLRNDIATNLFYDRNVKECRGFTTGFSAFGNPAKLEKKQILAIRSSHLPLKGFSIMQAKPIGLVGDLEDPQVIWDKEAGKWRMLICENRRGYKAVLRESDTWDGEYKIISGPVEVNSTGTQIQKIGDTRYAIFGSSDRKVYIYSYPDLKPVTELKMYLPPWNEDSRTMAQCHATPRGLPGFLYLTHYGPVELSRNER